MWKHLIASDLDGTLLPETQPALDEAVFEEIRHLQQRGVLFCAASGRSFGALRKLFAPVADDIAYLAENGARVYMNGQLLDTVTIPRALGMELLTELLARDDCEVRVNTTAGRFFVARNEASLSRIARAEEINAPVVTDPARVEGEITLITAITDGNIAAPAAELVPRWQNRIGARVTGEHWLDFTAAGKGPALEKLCARMGIAAEQVIAFGDNFNDVSMLEYAGTSYLMENACEQLKQQFPQHSGSVLETLRQLERQNRI